MSDSREVPEPITSGRGKRQATTTTVPRQESAQHATTTSTVGIETRGSKRPYSWDDSQLIQPPPAPATRSIGVHAILNPPAEGDGGPGSGPALASPPQRASSSPQGSGSTPNPSQQRVDMEHPSVSPAMRPRRIITPVSPANRYFNTIGSHQAPPGKVSVSQSPFVQDPSTGIYQQSSPTVSLPLEATKQQQQQQQQLPASGRHFTPHPPSSSFQHDRRLSGGVASNSSNSNSRVNSPSPAYSTPQSTYSSSYFPPHPPPPPSPSANVSGPFSPVAPPALPGEPLPYGGMDHLSRTPSAMGSGPRLEEQVPPPPPPPYLGPPQMLPPNPHEVFDLVIDYKSGSRLQAEKRKANSDASRRFRNRKKHEAALEQKIAQLTEEIRQLTEERDFYRSERDFFRERLGRVIGMNQLPTRPPSPRHSPSGPQQATSVPTTDGQATEPGGGSTESSSEQVSTTNSAAAASTTARGTTNTTLPQPQPTSTGGTTDPASYATSTCSSPASTRGSFTGSLPPIPTTTMSGSESYTPRWSSRG
ncbi:hypothetical protein VTN31DRAFT_2997 [Thermomyces dupontii]|uniref:uncharacterized protein n=1 Tax=Talaromyces thermophilus TaxID=28565 RepID=UPI00374250CA